MIKISYVRNILDRMVKAFASKPASDKTQSKLERYIIGKEPTSISDVEYWTRQYDRQHRLY